MEFLLNSDFNLIQFLLKLEEELENSWEMLNREIVDRQIKQDWKIERVAEEEERKSDGVESVERKGGKTGKRGANVERIWGSN